MPASGDLSALTPTRKTPDLAMVGVSNVADFKDGLEPESELHPLSNKVEAMHTASATAQNTLSKLNPDTVWSEPLTLETFLSKTNDTKTPYRASLRIQIVT
jgi:hypothetical protein